jgi:peptidoglycan/xylan/chitin deacetylase (PgdA/CDA1 family)
MLLTAGLGLTVSAAACTAAASPSAAAPPGASSTARSTAGPGPAASAVPGTGTPRSGAVRQAAAKSAARCPAAPYGPHLYAPGSGPKTVALTFDDGPGKNTAAMLAVLARYRVPATFFNIGAAMAGRPSLVREEVAAGYAMGDHSQTHPHLTTLPATAQAAELAQARAEQQSIAGTAPCVFRPPYGEYDATTLKLAQQQGMSVWLWSVDTLDWEANGSASAYWVQRIIRAAEQGAALSHPVLLMHDGRGPGSPATVTALPAIIQFFQSRGYRFVPLT